MAEINHTFITGRIINEPEIKVGNSVQYLKITVANQVSYDKGEVKGKTNFYNILLFGKDADKFSHLKKGDRVSAEGRCEVDINEHNGRSYTNLNLMNCRVTHLADFKRTNKTTGESYDTSNVEGGSNNLEFEDDDLTDEFPF